MCPVPTLHVIWWNFAVNTAADHLGGSDVLLQRIAGVLYKSSSRATGNFRGGCRGSQGYPLVPVPNASDHERLIIDRNYGDSSRKGRVNMILVFGSWFNMITVFRSMIVQLVRNKKGSSQLLGLARSRDFFLTV